MGEENRGFGPGATLLAFFLGGVVGAGVALLVAPASGRETRRMIKDLSEDAKERTEHYLDEVKTKAATVVEKGKGFIEEKKSVFSKAFEAGKDAYDQEKDKLSES